MERHSATPRFRHALLPFADAGTIPLFQAACLFAVGIAAARVVWVPPSMGMVAVIALVGVCGLAARWTLRLAWMPLALLWLLLGTWCAEMEPQPAPSPALVALSDGLLRSVEGVIVDAGPVRGETEEDLDNSSPVHPLPSQRLDLRVSSVEVVSDDEDVVKPIEGGVRLTVRWANATGDSFHCGEHIRAVARLLPPAAYHDAGAWSNAEYLVDRGITATAAADAGRVERLGLARQPARLWPLDPAGASLRCLLSEAQRSASARLMQLPYVTRSLPAFLRLTQQDAVMLSAMITGDRTFLTHSLRVGFERTGSFHMLVVSGFHLAIVSGCIFWFAKRLRLPRIPATLITMVVSFAYALFTGFATPIQRSLGMVVLYLTGRLVHRERRPLNAIGFAALGLLVISPRSLFEAGFQMTLLAVVSIGGIAAPWLEATVDPYLTATRDLRLVAIDVKLPPRQAQYRVTLRMFAEKLQAATLPVVAWRIFPALVRFTLRAWELFVVSAVVELAMTLPMAQYFHRITVFALPVNMLILPLLLLLVPAAILTLLVLLAWPAGALVPAAFTAVLFHAGVALVHVFGSFRFGDLRIPTPSAWQVLLFCLLLGLAVVLARTHGLPRHAALAALALAAVVAVVPRTVQHPRDALLFEAIDVGQGDSLLLITPEGHTLLVDGGGFGGGPAQAPQEFDIGEEVVSAALWSRGIRHLDAVALTHAHSDHMGGLPAILRNFHPSELWVGKNPPVAPYLDLLRQANLSGVRVKTLHAGDALDLGTLHVNVLAPFAAYTPGPEPTNNDSLVLRVAYGATSVMLEGDAEAPVERAMLEESSLASTVLKVGHHGSVSSSTGDFLARVSPQWAVISCGLRNRYGHPRPEVLEALQQAHIRTYSTDVNGAMCFALDGARVKPDPHCE
jgi:competence protein ComEC